MTALVDIYIQGWKHAQDSYVSFLDTLITGLEEPTAVAVLCEVRSAILSTPIEEIRRIIDAHSSNTSVGPDLSSPSQ